MNLQTLVNKLQEAGKIKPSRISSIKMSVRRYAEALGCGKPEECAEAVYALNNSARNQMIEKWLGNGESIHTIRNTKNDISFLLRQGAALNLIAPLPSDDSSLDEKTFGRRKLKNKLPAITPPEYRKYMKDVYSLGIKSWNENLRSEYDRWFEWVTTPGNKVGKVEPLVRLTTIEGRNGQMAAFFGFLRNVRGISELDFKMLIDVPADTHRSGDGGEFAGYRQNAAVGLLEEFVRWHINRHSGQYTGLAANVISAALSVATKFYLLEAMLAEDAAAVEKYRLIAQKIGELRAKMPRIEKKPEGFYNKTDRKISKDDLWRAAMSEFPRDKDTAQSPGTVQALRAGRAVAIMLLTEYPIRSRNLYQARVGQNIYRNADGKWIFSYEENKPSSDNLNQKQQNKFDSFSYEVSDQIAVYLEKYLSEWHPRLAASQTNNPIEKENRRAEDSSSSETYFLLNKSGKPFSRKDFSLSIARGIYRWFGVRVSPELIREIASEKSED